MRWHNLIVILILVLGLFLKLYRYTQYPQRGATSDEFSYAFLGLSLLNTGVPSSWSHFSAYTNRYDLTINDTYFPMVSPYFDHPPLFGLLVGAWSKLRNESTFSHVSLSTIRLVPIVLSSISAIFMYLFMRQLYGKVTAFLALAIYSIGTIFVMHHRVVLAENLLTLLFLAALYFYERVKKRLTPHYAFVLGVLAGASFWTKETGVAIFVTFLTFLFISKTKPKLIIAFTATFFLFLLGLIAYGNVYDGALFWKIAGLQYARDIGPQTLWYLLSTPVIVNKVFHDGWYFFGFLSLFALLRNKRYLSITMPFAFYFLLLMVSLTKEGQSGWYVIPLFPFMAMASAVTIVESVNQASWFFVVFLIVVGMFLVEQLFLPTFGLAPVQMRVLMVLILFPVIFLMNNKRKAFRFSAWMWVIVYLLTTTAVTLLYRHPA